MKNENIKKRREYQRLAVSGWVNVGLKNGVIQKGRIVNMSLGGLSFQVVDNGIGSDRFPANFQLDILQSENGNIVSNLPVTTVAKFELVDEYLPDPVKMWQFCAKFDEMSDTQQSLLKKFMYSNNNPPVRDRRRISSDERFNITRETWEERRDLMNKAELMNEGVAVNEVDNIILCVQCGDEWPILTNYCITCGSKMVADVPLNGGVMENAFIPKQSTIEPNKYYVAEVKLHPENERHRVIVKTGLGVTMDDNIDLIGSSDKIFNVTLGDLDYLGIVSEISGMNQT